MLAAIDGTLSVTFRITSLEDIQRLTSALAPFDCSMSGLTPVKVPKISQTRKQTFESIIALLKETFHEGFTYSEAKTIVFQKLDRKETSTRAAIVYGMENQILVKDDKTKVYMFVDYLEQKNKAVQNQELAPTIPS